MINETTGKTFLLRRGNRLPGFSDWRKSVQHTANGATWVLRLIAEE